MDNQLFVMCSKMVYTWNCWSRH